MKIRMENNGETLFLIPENDLVASNVDDIKNYCLEKLEEHSGAKHIVMDVKGIDLVDSLGVNLIVGLYREAMSASKTMEIVGAEKNFMEVASFFRLSSLFPVRSRGENE